VLITVDQNIPHQQNFRNRSLAIIVVKSRTTNIDDLIALMPFVVDALKGCEARTDKNR